MSAPTVDLQGVSHRYGSTNALSPMSLHLEGGSTAVLGANGSGKSTLLRLIATTVTAQSGSVRIGGLDASVPTERTSIRRRLGYATQHDGLPPRMTVGAYLDYVGALKELTPARRRARWAQFAMGQVGLTDAGERIDRLSGGNRRRLTLAQALLGHPHLLVLDEPLAGLDGETRPVVAALIASQPSARTVVVATHHTDELATVCDRAVVLVRGTVGFAGTPPELAAQADGIVWETATPPPSVAARAVAPGRFRVIARTPPPASISVAPSVQDGYDALQLLHRAEPSAR